MARARGPYKVKRISGRYSSGWAVYTRSDGAESRHGMYNNKADAQQRASELNRRHREEQERYRGFRANPSKRSVRKRVAAALKKYVRGNPAPVKGRKVKGGRAVTVKNFTGTIVKKADGTVQIVGRGRK